MLLEEEEGCCSGCAVGVSRFFSGKRFVALNASSGLVSAFVTLMWCFVEEGVFDVGSSGVGFSADGASGELE